VFGNVGAAQPPPPQLLRVGKTALRPFEGQAIGAPFERLVGRVCALAVRGTRYRPLVFLYFLAVLTAAGLLLVLVCLFLGLLASRAVKPSAGSARELESSEVEAASARDRELEAREP